MTGECYDHSRNFVWAESNLPYGGNLDVYEIDRIQDHRPVDGKFPIEKIDETLYGKEKFKSLREKIDWVCNNFTNAQKYVENDEEWTERIKEG
jgi:adenine-specific DNA-methyltransferase